MDPAKAPEIARSPDLGKGRQLLETKGQPAHFPMAGVVALPTSNPPAMDGKAFERAHKLAPDLLERARVDAAGATRRVAQGPDGREAGQRDA